MIRSFEEAMRRRRAVNQVKDLRESNQRELQVQAGLQQAVSGMAVPSRPWWSKLCRIRFGG